MSSAAWLFIAVCLLAVGRPASAQARAEVAGSYVFLWESTGDDYPNLYFPAGWSVSTAVRVFRAIDAVAEASGSYHFDRVPDREGLGHRNERYIISRHGFAGGPRITATLTSRVRVHGQWLFGRFRYAGDPEREIGWSEWLNLMQPGAGVTLQVARRLSVRAAFDLPIVAGESGLKFPSDNYGHHRLPRVSGGVVFR